MPKRIGRFLPNNLNISLIKQKDLLTATQVMRTAKTSHDTVIDYDPATGKAKAIGSLTTSNSDVTFKDGLTSMKIKPELLSLNQIANGTSGKSQYFLSLKKNILFDYNKYIKSKEFIEDTKKMPYVLQDDIKKKIDNIVSSNTDEIDVT